MTVRTVLAAAFAAVRDQYRFGLGLFVAAPLAIALVVVPEFIQHVVEIRIGMFDSRALAHALSADPTRWAFGYAKLAGLVLAFLACARAVWCGMEGGRWYDLRDVAWLRFGAGLALFVLIGSLAMPLEGRIPPGAMIALNLVLSIVSIPFLFIALAGWFGDRTSAWRPILTRCWPAVALLLLLLVTGYGPAFAIHALDHRFALGRPAAIVWALMLWDALVVGALAALVGAGFAVSYRAVRRRVGPATAAA